MEPRIQYAKTADGVSIAYWTLGEGPPFVYMAYPPYTHIQAEWQNPELRTLYSRLAEERRVIRYDRRGCGLSEKAPDFSLEATIRDLQAVVDHLDLGTFDLLSFLGGGVTAIAYAAGHPQRLGHLILENCYASGAEYFKVPQAVAFDAIGRSDWSMFAETAGHVFFGWSAGEPARELAAFIRDFVTPEMAMADTAERLRDDVTTLLPEVETPTLVVQHRQVVPGLDIARQLASSIPNARLVVMESGWLMDMDAEVRIIEEFLSDGEPAVSRPLGRPSGLVTVLFTDIEESTATTYRLGDARAQDLLREHNAIVRQALNAHGGTEIKHTGDGIMASFSLASAAIDCSIAIQRNFAARNAEAEQPLRVRVGLNAGEPVAEDWDLFGAAVQLARRICDRAQAADILVSNVVRELAMGKGFLFADRGAFVAKGFEEPVRVFEVRWHD